MFDDFLESLTRVYKEFGGEVYYDSKENRFLQFRGQTDDYLIFGQHTEYFSSAKTVLPTQQLSYKYAKSLKLVKGLDEIPGVYYNGISWCVKKDKNHNKEGER